MDVKAIVSIIVLLTLCAMFLTIIILTYRCIESMQLFDVQCNNEMLGCLKPKRV
ncbi:MAG: hypothetical protein KBE02_00685 [Sulfurospirillum sp.]|nr:hypothetical protein [Campylobacteraceae bacterium]MBP9565782.1 hypothetical protein [Sulfurospirillum sp.]